LEWYTVKIDHEAQQVIVRKNKTGIAPKWKGLGNFDVPFELAQEVGVLLTKSIVPEFLDRSAQIELQRQQNIHNNLDWDHNKWIIDYSEDFSQLYLWNFSGHKINRALSRLIETEFNSRPHYDYLKIVITVNEESLLTIANFNKFLVSLQSQSEYTLRKLLEKGTNIKWFSKFSECLPDSLAIKTICEKDMDLNGLIRELNRITIVS
jgi:ATP-dependent Lhr-like helicase